MIDFAHALQRRLVVFVLLTAMPAAVWSLDLLPGLFEKEEVRATIWELNEQFVRLVRAEKRAEPNDHPANLDAIDVEHALSSMQLWIEGGILRDEESVAVFPRKQAALIARYVTEALGKASPDEDVVFNVRGYTDVMLSLVKEREWASGRVFYREGKLNLIVGEHRKRIDKAKKSVEGSFGIIDDFRDVHFDTGSRNQKGKMEGRIVTTDGVELAAGDGDQRPDWVQLDVAQAALAFRESETPAEVRKEEQKAKAEAAKLTLERRQMREEMARMRKELQDLREARGDGASESVEMRLGRLQELHAKGLITEADFVRRKAEILDDL